MSFHSIHKVITDFKNPQILKPKLVFTIIMCTQTSEKYLAKEEYDVKISSWLAQWKPKNKNQKAATNDTLSGKIS